MLSAFFIVSCLQAGSESSCFYLLEHQGYVRLDGITIPYFSSFHWYVRTPLFSPPDYDPLFWEAQVGCYFTLYKTLLTMYLLITLMHFQLKPQLALGQRYSTYGLCFNVNVWSSTHRLFYQSYRNVFSL